MHISKKKVLSVCSSVFVLTLILSMTVFAAEKAPKPQLYATFWALIPPVVAIALALITKEVYSSLFVGILVGALLYSGFSFEKTVVHIFEGGIISALSYGQSTLQFHAEFPHSDSAAPFRESIPIQSGAPADL